jgi:riboflavin-specific deaminase-like protein
MRLIFCRDDPAAHGELSDPELTALYRHRLPATGVWLRSNFVASLDGSIQGPDGRSGSINTPSDNRVFALHRAHCDAILVGAGTARAEGYRAVDLAPWQREIRAAEGLTDFPLLAIVSSSLNLDPAIARARDPEHGPVMIVTSERAADEQVAPLVNAGIEVLRIGVAEVDLHRAVAQLASRGFGRLLCEGGPRLHRDLLADGLVDSLSLTLAPVAVGGEGSRTTSGARLVPAPSFELDMALHADDQTLFTQYVRR